MAVGEIGDVDVGGLRKGEDLEKDIWAKFCAGLQKVAAEDGLGGSEWKSVQDARVSLPRMAKER